MTAQEHVKQAEWYARETARAMATADGLSLEAATAKFAEAQTGAQLAQVHATLALVEQQRIANLIQAGAAWEDDQQDAFEPTASTLRPEVREGLGL